MNGKTFKDIEDVVKSVYSMLDDTDNIPFVGTNGKPVKFFFFTQDDNGNPKIVVEVE